MSHPPLSLSLLLLLPASALAQAPEHGLLALLAPQAPLALAFDEAGFTGLAGRELDGEAVVKGAPFCATAVHETVQPLTDGNRIVRKQSTRLCRDGEGRTRRELQRDGEQTRIYLRDPVARESWLLDPERKTARRLGSSRIVMSHGAGADLGEFSARWREQSERWRDWAQAFARRARAQLQDAVPPQPPVPPTAPTAPTAPVKPHAPADAASEPGIVIEQETLSKEPGGEPRRTREVRVIRLSELSPLARLPPQAPMPPLPPMAPLFGHAFMGTAGLGAGVQTALPARDIEGVKVSGERTSWTIPAGQLGNEKPIVITREVWRSPELMLTVSSRDADPRSGEISYRLEGIRRGEPDAALMKVPADYQQGKPRPAPAAAAPPARS